MRSAIVRYTYKVDGLCVRLLLVTAPCFAPQPLLRQRLDADLVNHVVRQVLTQQHDCQSENKLLPTEVKPTTLA